ncbi:MAG TPA: glycosyltransferase [Acidimicrobiales bacterium]|nr:glycosyltransferase [Acidimicrobiales bacterium]
MTGARLGGRGRTRQSLRTDQQERVDRGRPAGAVRLTVVVPAYQEGERAGQAVLRLRQALAPTLGAGEVEIIVVDDGSTDDTARHAVEAGADRVLSLPVNRGKGAAVRTGVLAARGRTVAFTDADLSYSPDQLVPLMEQVEAGWDMVVGSRRHVDTTTLVKAGRLREVTGRVFNLLTSVALLGQYRDTQCGLKAFRSDVARVLFGHQRLDGMAFDVELFLLAELWRLSLKEVPVTLSNSTRSTVRVVLEAYRMARDVVRLRWWAARGRYRLAPEESRLVHRQSARGPADQGR